MIPVTDHAREVAPGNVMRLKTPYVAGDAPRREWTHGIVAQVLHSGLSGGINNPHWRLSLHLYNPATGEVYLHEPSGIPNYVDFGADELVLVKLAREIGYADRDHDLYPACRNCTAGERHLYGGAVERCRVCCGFGAVFAPVPAKHPETV